MDQLNVYVLSRTDLSVKSLNQCFSYEINRDYLTNEKSKFSVRGTHQAQQGDFLLVKSSENEISIYGKGSSSLRPLYFGVIDSIENNSIVACDLYNLVNFSFPATRKTGTSFEQHIQTLLNYYLLNDTSKNIHNISVTTGTNTAHSYQPEDPPTPTNMIDYLINGFKKYNVIWEVDSIHYENNVLHVDTVLEQKTDSIQIKNNNYAFLNWEVYEAQVGRNLENKLLIVDKASADSENPTVLSVWYLAQDKTVTQSMNDNVWKPTKTKIYVYDTTQTDPPTYQEVAQSELKGNSYSHEINFDLDKTNNILTIDDLEIGLLATIIYNGKTYDSVLTGYVISSEHNFISLKFGHVRSTLSEALN